ncbi:HAD family hydrolase [Streptomyces cupreus]|uniref:HAD family hydrolase n=1 Tax=Streptomyces cupreus TaxID=2759956 RepID=UPI00300D3D7F
MWSAPGPRWHCASGWRTGCCRWWSRWAARPAHDSGHAGSHGHSRRHWKARYGPRASVEELLAAKNSADEFDHGKPAPDVFLEAARRLGAEPADCVVLEDAAPGAAAHAAGMRCIAIPYVAAQADAPEFATAGLLLRGGQPEFTARAAYEWPAGAGQP